MGTVSCGTCFVEVFPVCVKTIFRRKTKYVHYWEWFPVLGLQGGILIICEGTPLTRSGFMYTIRHPNSQT
jgi:hypothetical protein